MTEEEIVELTKEVFEESFEIDPSQLTLEAHIFTDLGLDSLDIVDLIVALQHKFGVKIRDNAGVREIRTLGDICKFIATVKDENVVKDD